MTPLRNDLIRILHRPPRSASNEETINMLAGEGKSLGRFGDGEMMLILQSGDLSFQKQNARLAHRLEEVLQLKEENFLVGLPDVFTKKVWKGEIHHLFLSGWIICAIADTNGINESTFPAYMQAPRLQEIMSH